MEIGTKLKSRTIGRYWRIQTVLIRFLGEEIRTLKIWNCCSRATLSRATSHQWIAISTEFRPMKMWVNCYNLIG